MVTGGRPGPSGGSPATGGSATGGKNDAPVAICAPFCKTLVRVCGAFISSDLSACRSQCVQDFAGMSMKCQGVRHDALACVEKVLSAPMVGCDVMPRILQVDCAAPLARSAACDDL